MSDEAADEEHDGQHKRGERCRAMFGGPRQLSIIEYTLGIIFLDFQQWTIALVPSCDYTALRMQCP